MVKIKKTLLKGEALDQILEKMPPTTICLPLLITIEGRCIHKITWSVYQIMNINENNYSDYYCEDNALGDRGLSLGVEAALGVARYLGYLHHTCSHL